MLSNKKWGRGATHKSGWLQAITCLIMDRKITGWQKVGGGGAEAPRQRSTCDMQSYLAFKQ